MIDKLITKIKATDAPIVVGLDPMLSYIPNYIKKAAFKEFGETLEGAAEAVWQYNKGIVDATYDLIPAVKPQVAMYEQFGLEGMKAFKKTVDYCHKKGLGEIDYETITKIPKDLVVVEIPSEIKMDPIGWNRLHGFDLKEGLRETGLQMNFTAKQAKWEDIYVPQKIKENLAQLKREKQQNKPIKTSQNQQSKKGRKM